MNKKYLLQERSLKEVKNKIEAAENIFLFLDYDGTLAPFSDKPEQADAFPGIKAVLKRLLCRSDLYICLISGRALNDLESMLKLKGLNYAGSHGLEIDLNFAEKVIYPIYKKDEFRSVFEELLSDIELKINDDIKIEDKGFAAAFHCNNDLEKVSVQKTLETKIKKLSLDNLEVISGRQVVEIRPAGWNKGKAVNYIADRFKKQYNLNSGYNIYLGDDRTDEDAFAVIEKGLSIYVKNSGDLHTSAEYYLNNPEEVYLFLRNLL
ncbi:trehalose 6-phosphatase [Halanaerobium sp. DL-01]|uniref:trehalose-phosphatase n=1 Tax=Halanaerobium sp. DL-01 TaxID=1653064 RepID=UPI000DF3BEE8|nr:trehalose-phosphatase [Halanaerobium sp. DL-01]RCW84944.1 trehalose 6-phosphatase [Halanaerobium sp. DL-01]